jgi:hypothetical protein
MHSEKTIVSFVGSAAMRTVGHSDARDSSSTDGSRRSDDIKKPQGTFATPSPTHPPSQGYWRTPVPEDGRLYTTQGGHFFAPSSPDLHSVRSMTVSEGDSFRLFEVPIHLQPIPVVITTPPSPTPSQKSRLSVITSESSRERDIARARDRLPALQRF